jgi:hypothetical protein
MEEQKNKTPNIFEFFNKEIKPILFKIKKMWFIPLITFIVAALIGFYIEKGKPTIYNANISYILEDEIINDQNKMAASGGQLLTTLMGQSPASNKTVMVDLSLSNKLVEQTLLRDVVVHGKNTLLVNYYIQKFGFAGSFQSPNPYTPNYKIGEDPQKDYMLRVFSKNIKFSLISKLKESGILTMDFSSTDEDFTKLFLEGHLKTISEFYIEKKMERAKILVNYARKKRDSLLNVLQGKTAGAASVADNLFGAVMKRAHVGELQLNRDIVITNQQYSESVMAVGTASMDLERKRPFISVVDDIRLPLDSSETAPLKKSIIFGIVGLLLGIALIVGLMKGKEFLQKQKSDYLNKSTSPV